MTLGGLAIAVGLLVDAAIIMVENILHRLTGATTRRGAPRTCAACRHRSGAPDRVCDAHRDRRVPAAVRHDRHRGPDVSAAGGGGDRGDGGGAHPGADARADRGGAGPEAVSLGTRTRTSRCFARSSGGTRRRSIGACGTRVIVAVVTLLDCRFRALVLGLAHRQRLHAAAGRGRVPAADRAAGRSVARRSRSPQPPRRRRPARGARGRRRGAADGTCGADRRSDAAHRVRRARRAQGRSITCARGRSRTDMRDAARRHARAWPCCSRRRSGCASTRGWAARRRISRCGSSAPTSTSCRASPSRPSKLMRGIEGIADLRAEQLTGLPQLQIAVNREATARVGLAPGDVIRADQNRAGRRRGVADLARAAPLRPRRAAARRSA